jgi:signal transduction histidine kinase
MKQKIEGQLISGIDDALAQVSAISNNLSPHVLRDFGLKVAIEKYIARVNKVSNISIYFDFEYNGEISNAIETTLYRVAIELINNTVKHAQATEISLIIDNVNEYIQFVFTDNGKGFELDKTKKSGSGMGLFNIENRIKSFNGQLSFEKGEESGIAYNILIPAILL